MLTKLEENSLLIIFRKKFNKRSEKNINDNQKKLNKNIYEKDSKFDSINLNHHYYPLINLILFELILILLPKKLLLDDPYIELKVLSTGYQQILSDSYTGIKPSAIYVNNDVQIMKDLKVYVESPEHIIRIEWENTLTNFTYMFSNLSSITSVKMNKISRYGCNLSYMFYNCNNLENFSYVPYDYYDIVKDTISMFYNCSSLKTFSFNNLYMYCDGYDYNNDNDIYTCSYYSYFRNMSYMFYNCQSLTSVTFGYYITYVKDMRGIFYNCQSLTSLNLNYFRTHFNEYVDLSYMCYNCKQLSSFSLTSKFFVKDINNMFYNCESLTSINLKYFNTHANYHINMSRAFYNCHNLTIVDFNNFNISDTREMFFNCTSFRNIINENGNDNYIYIRNNYINHINMSKMFFNCYNLYKINLISYSSSNRFPVNDFNLMFYNCSSLTSVYLQYFDVSYVQNMSYMFYNCTQLEYFYRYNILDNIKVGKRTMKGMFQNCKSLSSLDLRNYFYTRNVEIMWDMFKGCSSLTYLDLSNFDTSGVTDMESMFEGCYKLVSLNLNNFNTQNVLYMNRMFYNCLSLQSLYFHSISSDSLGTMQHMFYNCSQLKYLDLYSLKEKDQSIVEMFEGASTNFKFCIEENEYIPNIFKEFLEMVNTRRDCDSSCYYNQRRAIPEKKLCCKYVEYNENCYERCPSRTKTYYWSNYKKCENFSCNYYYNYNQNDCINYLPYQHFVNDTNLKTIDRCHPDCETCYSKALDSNHTNCLTCANSKFIYLGTCYSTCLRGSYYNYTSRKTECFCFDEKCIYCPDEYARQGLCSECNITAGYYKRENDTRPPFNCYKQLDKYYLDEFHKVFKPCYNSCQACNKSGSEKEHNCLSCNAEHSFILKRGNYFNCYSNCSYYFYFDKNNNDKYTCTKNFTCPTDYELIAPIIGQCVKFCNETDNYKYNFGKNAMTNVPLILKKKRTKNIPVF